MSRGEGDAGGCRRVAVDVALKEKNPDLYESAAELDRVIERAMIGIGTISQITFIEVFT
jgi:hypothetical protein